MKRNEMVIIFTQPFLSVCVCVCLSGEKNKTAPNLLIANKVVTLDELHVMLDEL